MQNKLWEYWFRMPQAEY